MESKAQIAKKLAVRTLITFAITAVAILGGTLLMLTLLKSERETNEKKSAEENGTEFPGSHGKVLRLEGR